MTSGVNNLTKPLEVEQNIVVSSSFVQPIQSSNIQYLVGGLEHFSFFHILGIVILTNIFQRGSNHHPDIVVGFRETWAFPGGASQRACSFRTPRGAFGRAADTIHAERWNKPSREILSSLWKCLHVWKMHMDKPWPKEDVHIVFGHMIYWIYCSPEYASFATGHQAVLGGVWRWWFVFRVLARTSWLMPPRWRALARWPWL